MSKYGISCLRRYVFRLFVFKLTSCKKKNTTMFPFRYVTIILAFGFFAQIQSQFTFCFVNYGSVNSTKVTFTLYTRTISTGVLLTNLNLNSVISTKRTVFVNHGWLQSGKQGWVIQMVNDYLIVEDINVIVVDWSTYASCLDYGPSADAALRVGVVIGDFIWQLVSGGYAQLQNVQINGFSLGAHSAGIAGQQVQVKSGGSKIGRINALEATSVGFETKPSSQRVDASDASFVQAWHTSMSGMMKSYGTVDVYFNLNHLTCKPSQPECPLNPGVPNATVPILPILFCDHIRSVVYWITTITKPANRLLSIKFTCPSSFVGGAQLLVGEYCPSSAQPGSYFLNTDSDAPWALDVNGIPSEIPKCFCS